MKKRFLLLTATTLLVISVSLFSGPALAETGSSVSSLTQLQALVNSLLQQIQVLQIQINALIAGGNSGSAGIIPPPPPPPPPPPTTANPQYLLISPQANNELINGTNLADMIAIIGTRGTQNRRLGFILRIFGFDDTDPVLVGSRLDKAFALAESLDVPLMLHIDFENWWETRPELWNWWDPNLPGYNPNNKNNVEWSDWNTPTKSSFLNWGNPLSKRPMMCYESAAVRQDVRTRAAFIAGKVNAWRARLSDMGKSELFTGVNPTFETGIVNSIGSSFVPPEAQVDLGWCALTARGFSAANPPADRELELARAVKSYSDFEVKTFLDLGIPKDKLYTHISGAEGLQLPYHSRSPLWTALNDYSVAGFSLYPNLYSRTAVLSTLAGRDWAITEMPWTEVLSFINEPNLKLLALYNWDHLGTAGQSIATNPAAIAAIKSALGTGYQRWTGNAAKFVSQNIPTAIPAGETVQVSVTIKNTGLTTWAGSHRLGSQNPKDNMNWGIKRVFMNAGETIAPGITKIFTFIITAPTNPGTYQFSWRMVQENVEWFGDTTPSLTIMVGSVVPPPPPPPPGIQVTAITSLQPTSGPSNTSVTIMGNGFTSSGNKVKFGNLGSENNPSYNLNSSDGHTLTFTVPSSNYLSCWNAVPRCLTPVQQTQPGTYQVSVQNANGTSNAVNFTVVSGSASAAGSAANLASALVSMAGILEQIQQLIKANWQ